MAQGFICLHIRLSCHSKSFACFTFVVKRLSLGIARVFCAWISEDSPLYGSVDKSIDNHFQYRLLFDIQHWDSIAV